tara:strand:- start:333 stop:479 length:147 start_codon:yes stop_codon:yes gene_type:complete
MMEKNQIELQKYSLSLPDNVTADAPAVQAMRDAMLANKLEEAKGKPKD